MPDTWKNGEHVDHDPIVEARAAHLMGHQRRVARSAVAIQTGCRAACREQTAADVLEARKALLLFLSVRTVVYEKGPVRFPFHKAQAVPTPVARERWCGVCVWTLHLGGDCGNIAKCFCCPGVFVVV